MVLRNRNKRGRASMAHWLTIAAKRYILIADGSARGGQQHQFLCPCVLARLLLQDPMHQEVTSKRMPDKPQGTLGQPCGHHERAQIGKFLFHRIRILVVWVTRPAETPPIIGQRGKAWSKKGRLLSPGLTTFSPSSCAGYLSYPPAQSGL
jgi:hypothetical protein